MSQADNLAALGSNVNSSGVLQPASGGTGATTTAGAANAILPSQTGNTGKYLTTDGTNTSWGTVTSNPGTVTSITAGTGLSGGTITSSGTIAINNTAVTAGSYTNASLTVNAQGQLTAASSGTAPVTSVTAGTGISVSGTTTPTVTNTGVTSVTAGSGISVSASTGGVTISASGGGVTSLNGQTGAITDTSTNTIGSYIVAWRFTGTIGAITYGTTTAGSNLRIASASLFDPFQDVNNNSSLTNPSLSGTWRSMTHSYTSDQGCGNWRTWACLWVRVS